jgi:hypothetical protein
MQNSQGKSRPTFEGKHAALSEKIVNLFYKTHFELGYGFSEKIYQRAYGIALCEAGLNVEE